MEKIGTWLTGEIYKSILVTGVDPSDQLPILVVSVKLNLPICLLKYWDVTFANSDFQVSERSVVMRLARDLVPMVLQVRYNVEAFLFNEIKISPSVCPKFSCESI